MGTPQESIRSWREPGAKSAQKSHSGAFSIEEKPNYSIASLTTYTKQSASRYRFPLSYSKFPLGTPQESHRKCREPGATSVQKPHSGAFSKGEKSNPLLPHGVLSQAVNRQPGCLRSWREPGAKSVQKPHSGAFSIGEKPNYSIASLTTYTKQSASRCRFPLSHSKFPFGTPQESLRK